MSEAAEQEQQTTTPPAAEVSPAEAEARAKGWVNLDEWKEQGKDPDDWITDKHFNERGQWIAERRQLHSKVENVDKRLADNNKVWEATLDARLAQLQEDKKQAIKLADEETVEKIDKQIEDAKGEKAKAAQPVGTDLNTPENIEHENKWLAENKEWYEGDTPKAAYAQKQIKDLFAEGYAGKQLTDEVERRISKAFPPTNPNRDKGTTDAAAPPPNGKGKTITSIDQLSGEDKHVATALKNRGLSDKQIIQMINDREKR